MSDSSQGPGWWLASDGKWYPPDQTPAPPDPQVANKPPAPSPAPKSTGQNTGWLWCLGIFLVLVVIGLISDALKDDDSSTTSGGSNTPSSDDLELGAWNVCHQFVEDRLKAPSTADFEDVDEYKASNSAGVWTIVGWVDSENSFGAKIRTDYVCKVRHVSGQRFNLVDLQTSP